MIASSTVPYAPGLPEEYRGLLAQMWAQLWAKRPGNQLRRQYVDYKAGLRDLGIAIPPALTSVETVVGWPAKGISGLVRRAVLDGFTTPNGVDPDALGLTMLWDENRLELEQGMTHASAATSSVAFGFVQVGDELAGEPPALITMKSAEWATGIWDYRKRALKAALSIIETSPLGEVTRFDMHVPGMVIAFRLVDNRWDVQRMRHDLGMPVEPFVHEPSLDRPFGRSRVSRAVMALTDSGVRTLLRSEVSAEFFSAPQRYALGADENTFVDGNGNPIPAWQSIIGRMLAVGRDEDGEVPTVGQFSQQSFEPHFAQVRQIASLIASEFNMTPRSFGMLQDNPESADAINAAKEDLVLDAKNFMASVGPSWRRLMVGALRIIDDSPAAREVYRGIRPHFANPATPSVVSASDALVKQATVIPGLADSDVALEQLGWEQSQIARFREDQRRARGSSMVEALAAVGRNGDESA